MQNPFIQYQDELAVSRDDDTRFLGRSMFWKHLELMHPKHLYRPSTVEYRSVKVMILESFLILLMAVLFTGHIALSFNNSVYKHLITESVYWGENLEKVGTVDDVWDWLSSDFVPKLFVQEDSYANVSAVVTPPAGWLNMTTDESEAYIRANGIFEVSATNPGWTPHYLNKVPFEGAVLLGTVRLRQIASIPSYDCYIGDVCYTSTSESTMDKSPLIGTPGEIVSSFSYSRGNETQQESFIRGQFGKYSNGGYVFDFPLSKASSLAQLNLLKEWSWVDPSTRALLLEFSSVNTRIKSITNSVVLVEILNGGVYTSQSFVPIWLWSRTFTAIFFVNILTFSVFVGYGLYIVWVIFQSGFFDFLSYFWNIFDLTILLLFFIYLGSVASLPNNLPSILSPVFSALPGVFFPFSTYQSRLYSIFDIASVLSVFIWLRCIKCCLLIPGMRTVIRVLERSIVPLLFALVQFFIGFVGLFLAWSIAFSSYSILFYTPSVSWTSLWLLAVGLFPQTDSGAMPKPLLAVLGAGFVLIMFLALPAICLGTIYRQYSIYADSIRANFNTIKEDRSALYPVGSDRESFWHADPVGIFAYTWYNRMKGVELIREKEADVGSPDEQVIELVLLPKFLQDKWTLKKAELEDLMSTRKIKANNLDQRQQSMFGRALTQGVANVYSRANSIFQGKGRTMTSVFSPTSPARDHARITRIQLQRLLDTDPEIASLLKQAEEREKLGALSYPAKIRAIDVIRKYTSTESVNRRVVFEKILGSLSGSAASADEVKGGLTRVIAELDSAWKEQLGAIMESCTELTIELVALKSLIEAKRF